MPPPLTWSNLTAGGTGHTLGARPAGIVYKSSIFIADANEMLLYDYSTDTVMAMGMEAYTGTPTVAADKTGSPKLVIATDKTVYLKKTYHDEDRNTYGNPSAVFGLTGDGTAQKITVSNLAAGGATRTDKIQIWMTVPITTGILVESMQFFLVAEAADTTATQTIDLSEEEISASGREVLEVGGVGTGRSHDAPSIGKYLAMYDGKLWLSGVSSYEDRVYMASAEEPEYWDTDQSFIVPGTVSGLANAGNELLVFTTSQTYAIVGSGKLATDYSLVLRSEHHGCLSNYSIKEFSTPTGESFLLWLARHGIMKYQGGAFSNLSKKYIDWFDDNSTKWVANLLQYAQGGISFEGSRYYLSLPETGSAANTTEIVYNTLTDGLELWTGRAQGSSGIGTQWYGRYENREEGETVLFADNVGMVFYETPSAWTDDGTAIDMDFRTRQEDFDDPGYVKNLTNIEIKFDDANTSATSVSVQVSEDRSATFKPSTAVSLTVADYPVSVGIGAGGRTIACRIRENTDAKSCRVSGLRMEAVKTSFRKA